MYHEIDLKQIDINQEPPVEEPERQYYFMAKCREHVEALERKLGRRPCFFTQTFGCQSYILWGIPLWSCDRIIRHTLTDIHLAPTQQAPYDILLPPHNPEHGKMPGFPVQDAPRYKASAPRGFLQGLGLGR